MAASAAISNGRRRGSASTGGAGHVGPMLSLVLLLLGFFAVLSATMERDAPRSMAVLQSVAATFGPILGEAETGAPFVSSVGDALALNELHDRIRGMFETIASVSAFEPVDDGGAARIIVPGRVLFVGDSAVARPRAAELLEQLAAAINEPLNGIVLSLDIRVGPAGSSGDTALTRAARLASSVSGFGVDASLIVTGRDDALADDVVLTIGWRPAAEGAGP